MSRIDNLWCWITRVKPSSDAWMGPRWMCVDWLTPAIATPEMIGPGLRGCQCQVSLNAGKRFKRGNHHHPPEDTTGLSDSDLDRGRI